MTDSTISRIVLAVFCAAFISNRSAFAQDRAIEWIYQTSATATLHEPITVDITVRNRSGEAVSFDFGKNNTSMLALDVLQPDGQALRDRRANQAGLGVLGEHSLNSGADYKQTLILNEWLDFNQIGVYQIRLLLETRFVGAGGAILSTPEPLNLEVEIAPRNETNLRETCARLAAGATGGSDVESRRHAVHALTYVRDDVAVPYLASILENTDRFDWEVIRALERIGTLEARVVLQDASQNADVERATMAADALKRIK